MITLLLTAAGAGTRAGLKENKIFYEIEGKTVLEKAYAAFADTGLIGETIVTASAGDEARIRKLLPEAIVVRGGATRALSVYEGLKAATGEIVLIHDCARPFVDADIIEDCVESVRKYGSGIAAYPSPDTIAEGEDGELIATLGKGKYVLQTPQGFYLKDILRAYERARGDEPDDSALYLRYIGKPRLSKGSPSNRKLTYAEDFACDFSVGNGFDIHRFAENRKLVLCGENIPYEKGLTGHSDADAPVHALMDALLSAAGLRDIGCYFPDTDPRYEGVSSMLLLEKVMRIIGEEGFAVKNATIAIVAEKPRLAPYIPSMRKNIAAVLGIDEARVGISATTSEKIGLVGREEGIAAYATALLLKK